MPELTVGVLFPTSGSLSADVGRQCVEAVRAATDTFVPPGWRVRLAIGDPATVERAELEAVRLVREEGARVLVGCLRSDLGLPESEVAERMGAVFWGIAGAAAEELTTRGFRRTFRLSASATNCYAPAAIELIERTLAPGWGLTPAEIPLAAAVEDAVFPQSFGELALGLGGAHGFPNAASVTCLDEVEDLTATAETIRASGAAVLLSAGFRNVVPRLWRALRAARPPLRAIVGISGWAFPRDVEFTAAGYERAFVLGGPYLYGADRRGLPEASRELLERWWAHASTPAGQDVALDRDLAYSGMYVLYRHVLPNAASASPDAIAAAASALDIPLGGTPSGYGVKFDDSGDNRRTFALVMQWQQGRRVTVAPERFATAAPDLRPPFA